ncbi:MAG: hypothetical protein ACK5X3_05505, partial [Pseudomonadota bacterium]
MSAPKFDKSKLPSRHTTVGPTSAAHRADGARAICYLIARDPDASADADALVASTDPDAAAAYRSLAELVARQSSVGQLALADLAAPALADLGRPGYS